MDTKISGVSLTANQIEQSHSLKKNHIKGFSFLGNGDCVVVSTKELSEYELSKLKEDLLKLPDEETQASIAKKSKKNAVLSKLKITEEELADLLKG